MLRSGNSSPIREPGPASYAEGHESIRLHHEERINGLTHAVGFVLAVAGSGPLLMTAYDGRLSSRFLSCVVYCIALAGVYAASTLSHWVHEPKWRRRFRAWDQGMIFVLIVATFTPLSITYLSGTWHVLTGIMWLLAIAGFVSKVGHAHRVDKIVLWFYLFLGWMPILALGPFWSASPWAALLVLIGGIIYSFGSALLMLSHRIRYGHAMWHLCVMLASGLHFWAIYRYVAMHA